MSISLFSLSPYATRCRLPELDGQVAAISGGLGDIGRACALELARRGADIAIFDAADDGRVGPLQAQIRRLGRRVRCDTVDASQAERVEGWVEDVSNDMGVIGLCVVAAAIVEEADFDELAPES